MRHTGGVALGAISTRSMSLDCARRSASFRDLTPSCCLFSSRTLTSRARILPLRRCRGSRERKEREGNGWLNQPPQVGIHSCRRITDGSIIYDRSLIRLHLRIFPPADKKNFEARGDPQGCIKLTIPLKP